MNASLRNGSFTGKAQVESKYFCFVFSFYFFCPVLAFYFKLFGEAKLKDSGR